jgi:addiction module HigA family antidote
VFSGGLHEWDAGDALEVRVTDYHQEILDAGRIRPSHAWRNAQGRIPDKYGLSQNQLAKAIGISPNRIADIVNIQRRITADTALRLSLFFGNSPEFWLNLQTHYDLKMARRKLKPEIVARIKAQRAA